MAKGCADAYPIAPMHHPSHARRRLWFAGFAVTLWVGSASAALAQCPDGSPPPCSTRRVASANPSLPPIDPREWIVVPFNNVTRAADVDWLREASVNLLTLEIGRWTDVQVVNDKRVGDLLRDLPPDRRSQALTLNDGLRLARRAGAGMLVMGDFVKLGRGARLSANVFDVRTGNRVRTVEQRLPDSDSLLAAFGPLSRGVLAVPPPPDARSGEIGTANLDAYQAYLAGVRALNHWDLDVAERELTRALAIDSTFALAHLYLSIKLGWSDPSGDATVRHALTAQRLGASLPPRERALIEAHLGIARNEFDAACKVAAPLAARDSNDVMALYMRGECAYHDNTVILPASDTLVGSVPWGWNLSLASMRRALQLDPAFHQAFQHVLDILRATQFIGCARRVAGGPCEVWRAAVRRDGDTLLIQPVSVARNLAALNRQQHRAAVEKPMVANLAMARRIAEAWSGADSTDEQAQIGLAVVMLSQGDVAAAEQRFKRVSSRALMRGDASDLRERMETAAKFGDATAARAWFDSLVKLVPDGPVTSGPFRGSMELMFARAGRLHGALDLAAQRTPATTAGPAEAAAYARLVPRVYLGFPTPEIAPAESAYLASMKDTATCRADCRAGRVYPSLALAMRAPRATWPAELQGASGIMFQPARAIALRDTAALRVAAQRLDSSAHARVAMLWPEDGHALVSAEAYLAGGDSTSALRMLRFAVDSAIPVTPITRGYVGAGSHAVWWSRAMWMRAELAAALRHTDEARKWYDRVLELWATADAEFQSDVERVRASRAALGSSVVP